MAEVWRVEYGEGETPGYEDVLVPDGCCATVENRVFKVTNLSTMAELAEIRLVVAAIRADLLMTAGRDPVPKAPGKVGKLFGKGKA